MGMSELEWVSFIYETNTVKNTSVFQISAFMCESTMHAPRFSMFS